MDTEKQNLLGDYPADSEHVSGKQFLEQSYPPGSQDAQVDLGVKFSMPRSESKDDKQYAQMVQGAMMIFGYCVLNIFLVMTNKQLISLMDFHFPVILTMMHMLSSVFFSYIFMDATKVFRKQEVRTLEHKRKIFYLAAMFAVSVLCGNWSLEFIHVSFATMIGATTPFFVCLLSFILFRECYHCSLYMSLLPIIGGSVLSTYGEFNLNMLGLVLALCATVMRGMKSVWQGHLLTEGNKLDSPNLLRHMSFYASILLFFVAVVLEGPAFLDWLSRDSNSFSLWRFALILIFNPISAYFTNMLQFGLTKRYNALTLQVIGNVNNIVKIGLSVLIFRNSVSFMAAVGYTITLSGVAWYSREQRKRKG